MNAQNAKDYLPLVRALAEGKVIQLASVTTPGVWRDCEDVAFCDTASHYRIKPEPRDFWINRYQTCFGSAYDSKEVAEQNASPNCIEIIHVREVL